MKITEVNPYVVRTEMPGVPEEAWAWTFVETRTNEDVTVWSPARRSSPPTITS